MAFAALISVGAALAVLFGEDAFWLFSKKTDAQFSATREAVKNPFMGFAAAATSRSNVGDNALVYIDITFRELEPEEGVFAFEQIEEDNHIALWKSQGKHAVLRFVCDIPGQEEHLDIPDWLYEKTNRAGSHYDHSSGKGFSPDYANPVFIESHARAVQALGKRFGRDKFVAYVQLGSLGHWGEWHVKESAGIEELPLADVRLDYILPYLDAFPHAKLLMRRPFAPAAEYGMGLYNDMTGNPESTAVWNEWIKNGGTYDQTDEANALVPMENAWKTAPIGGEFTSAFPMDWMVKDNLAATVGMIEKAHTTFLGPKFPKPGNAVDDARLRSGIEEILLHMGYRIGVTHAKIARSRFSPLTKLTITWENSGVAPMYFSWPVYLVICDSSNNALARYPIDLDTAGLLPLQPEITVTLCDLTAFENQNIHLCVGIYNPETDLPAVLLVCDAPRTDRLSIIGSMVQ